VKRVINVEDEEKEAQYGCCTFQTRRIRKDQAPVELAQHIRINGPTDGHLIGSMLLFR
jgi:hypothetical protein